MKIILTESQLALIHRTILQEGPTKPKTKKEITDFQNWVINVKKDKQILGHWGADGDWGQNSEKAWSKYGSSYQTKKSNLKYPFDVLSSSPQSKDIAEIIKKSNGGWFRNDYEDWAEAAFNKISNSARYKKVSTLLGKDVYQYIKDYMNTSKVYTDEGPSIDTTYNKLFKTRKGTSSDDSKKPKTQSDITKFQTFAKEKGFKNVTGRKKGQLISVDGSWGQNSEAAWQKYGSSYTPSDVKTETVGTGGFVIPFAFPEYEPQCDGTSFWATTICNISRLVTGGGTSGTYGSLGHAGIATITKSGNVQLFEFGRYKGAGKGKGLVKKKNLGKIATVKDGVVTNIDSVVEKVHAKTESKGPKEKIEWTLLSVPNVEAGITKASSITSKDYSALDLVLGGESANCATFVLEVVDASGLSLPAIQNPTPVGMIHDMEDLALKEKNPAAYWLKQSWDTLTIF